MAGCEDYRVTPEERQALVWMLMDISGRLERELYDYDHDLDTVRTILDLSDAMLALVTRLSIYSMRDDAQSPASPQ